MSLRAVTDAVFTIVNGITVGNFPSVQAYTEYFPPVMTATSHPQIFVYPEEGTDERDAMPRTYGLREVKHKVKLYYLTMFQAVETGTTAQLLSPRDLVEGILDAFRTYTPMELGVTDAQSGATSLIIDLGENMLWRMDPPQATASQRLTMYSGVIDLDLRELVPSA